MLQCWQVCKTKVPCFAASQKGSDISLGTTTGLLIGFMSSPAQNSQGPVALIAITGYQTDGGIFDLSRACISAQLAHQLDNMVQAPDMRLRQQTAMGVSG